MSLRKLKNTEYLKRNFWMVVSVEYAVEEATDLSQDALRYDDSNWVTGSEGEKQWFNTWQRQC
jgi:hypothetical protein